MTNNSKIKIVAILFLISIGLLIYNILNPYQEVVSNNNSNNSNSSTYSSSSSSNNNAFYSDVSTKPVPDEVVAERQPTQEEIWQEKYKGNQLANGSQPYRSIYGKNKQYGSSEIVVTAPNYEDALIMVKNNNNIVVRHAYIRSGQTYTFIIPQGYYQVFFICGKDWCPEKTAPNGQKGFFLYSSTSKDSKTYIDKYQSLTYTLQLNDNGNFIPQHTSLDEAF